MKLYQPMSRLEENGKIVSYTLLEVGDTSGEMGMIPSILEVDTEEFGELVKSNQVRRCVYIGEGPVGVNGFSLDSIITIKR